MDDMTDKAIDRAANGPLFGLLVFFAFYAFGLVGAAYGKGGFALLAGLVSGLGMASAFCGVVVSPKPPVQRPKPLRIQTNPDGTLDEIAGPAVLEHMGGDVWDLVFWDAEAPRGAGSFVHFNILRMDAFEGTELPRTYREPCPGCDERQDRVRAMHRRAQAAEGERDRLRAWALRVRDMLHAQRNGTALSGLGQRWLEVGPINPPTIPSGPMRWCGCGDGFWPESNDDADCPTCRWIDGMRVEARRT